MLLLVVFDVLPGPNQGLVGGFVLGLPKRVGFCDVVDAKTDPDVEAWLELAFNCPNGLGL